MLRGKRQLREIRPNGGLENTKLATLCIRKRWNCLGIVPRHTKSAGTHAGFYSAAERHRYWRADRTEDVDGCGVLGDKTLIQLAALSPRRSPVVQPGARAPRCLLIGGSQRLWLIQLWLTRWIDFLAVLSPLFLWTRSQTNVDGQRRRCANVCAGKRAVIQGADKHKHMEIIAVCWH